MNELKNLKNEVKSISQDSKNALTLCSDMQNWIATFPLMKTAKIYSMVLFWNAKELKNFCNIFAETTARIKNTNLSVNLK